MTRHDYGPKGCCAKKAAQAGLLIGIGGYLLSLAGSLGWRVTAKVLRRKEARNEARSR